MKKSLSLFLLLLLLCSSAPILSGCGGGDRASTDPADEMPAEEDLTEDPIAEDNA